MTLREKLKAQVRDTGSIYQDDLFYNVPVKKPRSSGLAKRGHEHAVLKLTEDKRYSHTHSKGR